MGSTLVAVVGHQRGILLTAVLEIVGYEVALHGARPFQRRVAFQVNEEDVHRFTVGIGVGSDAAILADMVAKAKGDELAGHRPVKCLALVDLVEQLAHEAREARLVEGMLEDLADQFGGFGLVHDCLDGGTTNSL